MFSPFKVSDFHGKIISIYRSTSPLNAGGLVDIDPTDASAIQGSVGFNSLVAGSIKLATIVPASNTGTVAFGRELGIAIPNVNLTGPTLQERILELASSYMTVPVGAACAVLVPSPGDIVATTEFVGYNLQTDTNLTGFIDITSTANMGIPVGINNGRFRKVQSTDAVRARYIGNTTVNGSLVGLFQFA